MQDPEFVTYRKFSSAQEASELGDILRSNGIPFMVEDNSPENIPGYVNTELQSEFRVLLEKENFDKADALFAELNLEKINHVEADYYLFEFSNEELLEILVKRDEWSLFDFQLAQKILKDRGQEVNDVVLNGLRKVRLDDLAKPEEGQKPWIILGYIFAIGGGLLGLFIGWYLSTHKKTLPNGERVYGFAPQDRKHGNRIFVIGLLFLIVWLILRLTL